MVHEAAPAFVTVDPQQREAVPWRRPHSLPGMQTHPAPSVLRLCCDSTAVSRCHKFESLFLQLAQAMSFDTSTIMFPLIDGCFSQFSSFFGC